MNYELAKLVVENVTVSAIIILAAPNVTRDHPLSKLEVPLPSTPKEATIERAWSCCSYTSIA